VRRKDTFEEDQHAIANFVNELKTSKRVDHRHVVKVVASFTDPEHVGIIMGTIADCDLKSFMEKEMVPERKTLLRSFFGCLVLGLKAIHSMNIRHKDIKPTNILVKSSVVLYTDFGIALDYSQTERSTTRGRPAMFTEQYCAPEVDNWEDQKSSSDIFSLAAVFLEMATILNNESIEKLRKYLDENGAGNSGWYCRCLPRIGNWISELQQNTQSLGIDRTVLTWISNGLQKEASDRPTIYQLEIDVGRAHAAAQYPLACHGCIPNLQRHARRVSIQF
jgi:serine/threonine protein kinase